MESNVQKMQKALDKIIVITTEWQGSIPFGSIPFGEVRKIAKAARKLPLRNCDVGSVWEQIERHRKWCHETSCHRCVGWDCFARWAQMPYEPDTKKEGEAK